MKKLRTALRDRLAAAGRVAILGVGSEMRGDDGVGIVVARKFGACIRKKRTRSLKVFLGHTAPENLTGEIRRFHPTHLVLIDAVDLRKKAGAIRLIDSDEAMGASFSTHKMPVRVMKDYLRKTIGCDTLILGVQPRSLDFSLILSPPVSKAARALLGEMRQALRRWTDG